MALPQVKQGAIHLRRYSLVAASPAHVFSSDRAKRL
jgi:hypothetical protein